MHGTTGAMCPPVWLIQSQVSANWLGCPPGMAVQYGQGPGFPFPLPLQPSTQMGFSPQSRLVVGYQRMYDREGSYPDWTADTGGQFGQCTDAWEWGSWLGGGYAWHPWCSIYKLGQSTMKLLMPMSNLGDLGSKLCSAVEIYLGGDNGKTSPWTFPLNIPHTLKALLASL